MQMQMQMLLVEILLNYPENKTWGLRWGKLGKTEHNMKNETLCAMF